MATKDKPKAIVIQTVTRSRRFISIGYTLGDEHHQLDSNENPLPSFTKALDALIPLTCQILEVPENYSTNLTVQGITMGTMRDVATVSIHAKKSLSLAGKMLKLATPPVLMSTPKTEGGITPPLKDEQASLVDEVVEEAKRYVKGERAQGTLSLDDDDEGEDEGEQQSAAPATAPLPFPGGAAGKPAKKQKQHA
jgi:hypothetical protein